MKTTVVELNQRDVFVLDLLRSQGHSTENALRLATAAKPWGQIAWWTQSEEVSTDEDVV